MTVIPVSNKRKDYRLVGATLPGWMCSYITLYTIAKGSSKAKIVKGLIDAWITRSRINDPEEKLIEEIITRINDQWQRVKSQGEDFNNFKDALTLELTQKYVLPHHVSMIIKNLKQ